MENWQDKFEKTDSIVFHINIFNKIGKEWFLIATENNSMKNAMTASWGTLGILWNKPVAMCFVRPSRHTFQVMEESDFYSLNFLGKENKDILNFCGSRSGRDFDKIKETGLRPVYTDKKTLFFEQSELVFECKKIYFDDIKPLTLIPDDIDEKFYSSDDYHRMYIGEVLNIYKKKME